MQPVVDDGRCNVVEGGSELMPDAVHLLQRQ